MSFYQLKNICGDNLNRSAKTCACLRIRLPLDLSRLAYKLAGKTLELGRSKIYLNIPELNLILPSPVLEARIVTIKKFESAHTFFPVAQEHLAKLGISGRLRILTHPNAQPKCRTVRIHQKNVVGFAVRVDRLSDRDSLILQEYGIGGRRKYGCGLFT